MILLLQWINEYRNRRVWNIFKLEGHQNYQPQIESRSPYLITKWKYKIKKYIIISNTPPPPLQKRDVSADSVYVCLLSPYTTYATCKDLTPTGLLGKFRKFQSLTSSEAGLGYFKPRPWGIKGAQVNILPSQHSRGMTEHWRRTSVSTEGGGYLVLLLRHEFIQDSSCQTCKLCPLSNRPDWGMTDTYIRRAITSANTYQHYNRDDPLSQQRRGKLLVMLWLDGASLYLVIGVYNGITDLQILQNSKFQPQHQPQRGASFSHCLTSVSRVQRRVVTLHAIIQIGAYNDVRVEVCIIIVERVFHDVLLSSISHQKHLFFQIHSRIWTCGKVLFELDMPHVKQNPSV